MTFTHLKLGTRSSPLALAQAYEARDLLLASMGNSPPGGGVEVVEIQTTGDRVLDRPLAEIGGKGLFSKELDRAQLDGRVDFAVHSMKDLETWMPGGVVIAAVLPREDARDAFLSPKAASLDDLPPGAAVGTSSVRRQAQVLNQRPDLKVTLFRGNVQTRLRKLDEGAADATILARAGLNRLGMADVIAHTFEPDEMLPAAAQGAVGITCREDDERIRELLGAVGCPITAMCVTAERAMLEALDGSCRTPIAGLASVDGSGRMTLRGLVARPDGGVIHRHELSGAPGDARALGLEAGRVLKDMAGPGFFGDPGD